MADSGSFTAEDASTNSSGSSNDATVKKPKGAKLVQSRYMQQYEKKKIAKAHLQNTTICSGGRAPERTGSGTPTRRSTAPQRFKAPTRPGVLNSTILGKCDLQSTLLEGQKIAFPDLDLSVINDKTFQRKRPKALFKPDAKAPKKEPHSVLVPPEEVLEIIETQTRLLTLLSLEIQKNIRRLEQKAERSLLLACEEKAKLQMKVHEQRHRLSLLKREQQLAQVLASQVEVLLPSTAKDELFQNEYTSFATALDSTRHELPIKNIHIEESRVPYLDKLQKHLAVTESLLAEFMPAWSEENAKTCTATRELEEEALTIDADLPRSLAQITDLAFKVAKETSLQTQNVIEDTQGVDAMRPWYFDEDFVV
ncbi:HAUS augmin-like complex subunit 8 isoform X2 [Ambystoma mexicanum]|uniref:HAUS augmin-like complex subunit 8 isoform X2 n=1 Tax=Ambystoma mexicanum TaxID=8296 RepID=UPI0037E95200